MKKKFLINSEFVFEKIILLLSAVIMAIALFSHTYNDILITTRHGINFWSCLLEGDFFDFYKVNVCASGNDTYTVIQRCAYNILVYIVFAIWNFPLFILERFFSVDVSNNILCIVYSKMLVAVGLAISAIILKKILAFLCVEKKQQFLFIY